MDAENSQSQQETNYRCRRRQKQLIGKRADKNKKQKFLPVLTAKLVLKKKIQAYAKGNCKEKTGVNSRRYILFKKRVPIPRAINR